MTRADTRRRHIDTLTAAIDRHDFKALYQHVHHVATIDATADNTIDGYPTTTLGHGSSSSGGGRRITVPDEHGHPDQIPVTATEAAALTRADWRTEPDPVHRIWTSSIRALETIANALDLLEANRTRLTNLRSTADITDPPQCYVAATIHHLPYDTAWEPFVATTFAGYLTPAWDEPRRVCRWTYQFVRDTHRLPTADEMRERLTRGSVRLRVRDHRPTSQR